MEETKKNIENIRKRYLRYLKLQRGMSPNTLDAYAARHVSEHARCICA